MKTITLVLLSLLAIGTTLVAHAETKVDFSAYARSGIHLGPNGNKGTALHSDGFAKFDRLEEGQYFVLTATTQLPQEARFVFTLANGGETFHQSGVWPGPGFAVRNLYFELEKLPDAQNWSAWFGSRMYRGNDIYLFDTWPVDNENILGGALTYHGSTDVEFAVGARSESGYKLMGGLEDSDKSAYENKSAQHLIFINKLWIPVAGSKKLKTNFEFHLIPESTGSYTGAAGGKGIGFNVPRQYGYGAGAQYEIYDTNNAFIRYAQGNLGWDGGAAVPAITKASPVESIELANGSTVQNPALLTKKGSQAIHLGLSNSMELTPRDLGVMYGLILQHVRPATGAVGTALTVGIRPMYYVSNHVHAGFELDGAKYFKESDPSDVSWAKISPMLEYALNKNVYGTPKFRLIASRAFYAREIKKYGEPTRSATNVSLGFELWF